MTALLRNSLTLLSLLAIVGAGWWFKPWQATAKTHDYHTETLSTGTIAARVSANGTLNPVVLVNVGTQISGVVNKLNVDFNDRVKKGQVLAEIDPALISAQLEQDQANLASAAAGLKLAEANAERAQRLYAQDYIARVELDQAQQALSAAQAQVDAVHSQLKRDRTNLAYTVIKSPVSGIIVSRSVDIGQTVAASFQTPTLFTIAQDLQKMQIDTSVAEADVGGVKMGQAVTFTVDAYPERVFQGQVRRIRLDSKIQQNVVTYDVVIAVDNADETLLPGMTAFVSILVNEKANCLKLPLAALKFRPSGKTNDSAETTGKTVYRLDKRRAIATPVQLGLTDGKYAEVLSGLKAGDTVILEDLSDDPPFEKKGGKGGGNFRIKAF